MSKLNNDQVVVIFTNDDGEYYLETVMNDIHEATENWSSVDNSDNIKIIENTYLTWDKVKHELNNPTTRHGEFLFVIQNL